MGLYAISFFFQKISHFWHTSLYAISFFWVNLGIRDYTKFHIGHVQFNEILDFLKIFNLASSHSNGHEVHLFTTKKCYFKNIFWHNHFYKFIDFTKLLLNFLLLTSQINK
jgi:hypothetical protein